MIDGQVKNALIKVYHDIVIKQSCSIFPTKRVEVTNKFLLTKSYQYERDFD